MLKKLTRFEICFLIGLILLYFTIIPPNLLFSPSRLIGGDTTAHSYYPHIVLKQCLPALQFLCWSDDLLMGYVVLQHYFPLVFIVSTILGLAIPLNIAFKLVFFLSILSPPICILFCARLLGIRGSAPVLSGALVALLMFAPLNHHMGFYILDNLSGQFSSTLALSLFFLSIGCLKRSVESNSWGIFTGLLMGCAFLAHAMLIPILAGLTYFMLFIFWRRDWSFVKSALGSMAVSTLLFSGWALPFLFDVNRSEAAEIKKTINLDFYLQLLDARAVTVITMAFLGLIFCPFSKRSSSKVVLALVSSCAILVSVSLISNSIGTLAVFDRFFPALLMALCLPAGVFMQAILKKLPEITRRSFTFLALCCCLVTIKLTSDTAHRWSNWNFEGFENKSYYAPYAKLAQTLKELPGNGRVAVFAMNNSKLTAGLSGGFAWETIGLLAEKPILATGTQGFYSLSFNAVNEHYYGAFSTGDSARLRFFNKIYAVSYIVKPKSLSVSALTAQDRLLTTIAAREGEAWEIYDVSGSDNGQVSYVHIPEVAPVILESNLSKPQALEKYFHTISDLEKLQTPIIIGPKLIGTSFDIITSYDQLKGIKLSHTCQIWGEKKEHESLSFKTTCPGQPHLISVSYNKGWQSVGGEQIYQALPNYLLITPDTENVDLRIKLTHAGLLGKICSISSIIIALLAWVRASFKRKL